MKAALLLIVATILLPLHSCSSRKDMSHNQKKDGHHRLYTYPQDLRAYFPKINDEDRYKEIVFVALNDLRGRIKPKSIQIADAATSESSSLGVGGVAGFQAYFQILKRKFPGQVQILSSGSLLDPEGSQEETIFYANYLGLDAAGLSRSEFSLPFERNYMESLDQVFKSAQFKVVSSNLFNLESAEEFKLANIQPSSIHEVNGVKVGYISVVSPQMAQSFDSFRLNKIYFQDMTAKIIHLSNTLRRQGAEVLALMVSHGIDCSSSLARERGINPRKVNFLPSTDQNCLLEGNALAETLAKLPPGMIDIVFTNGMESKAANVVAGYPVLQSFPDGESFSWAKLVYDTKLKTVARVKTKIMQPVQTCHLFFRDTEDCFVEGSMKNVELAPAFFLGEEVRVQPLPQHE